MLCESERNSARHVFGAGRWIVLAAVAALLLLRVLHITADFADHSFWADDHAKFSDEGWYANAAINNRLVGHWHLAGDWAPAVVVPAWPLLLAGVFHFTGVSIAAARVASVGFSCISLVLACGLFRRSNSQAATCVFAVLLAANAMTYAFSRLAILERPMEAVALFCLLQACALRPGQTQRAILLGASLVVLVLTKTTGAFLLPAIAYPYCKKYHKQWPRMARNVMIVLATAAALYAAEQVLFAAHYSADVHAFFAQSVPHVAGWATVEKCFRLLWRGTWIDPLLWPLTIVGITSSLWLRWLRGLWSKPLWGACVLWIGGYSAFIVYHFDGPPRYFSTMTVPVLMLAVMFTAELWQRGGKLGIVAAAACAISLAGNVGYVVKCAMHPQYTMADAARRVRQIEASCIGCSQLAIGHAANEISLYDGLPSIDDSFGTGGLTEKFHRYKPGWVLIWNTESPDQFAAVLQGNRLQLRGEFSALDDPARHILRLYQVVPSGLSNPNADK